MKFRIISILLFSALLAGRVASAIQPLVGDVKDTRTTGQFFAGLELDLKLVGDDLASYSSVRTSIERATDDTGRNLIKKEPNKIGFQELLKFGGQAPSVKVELINPARKAGAITEVIGKLEFYSPTADPNSVIKVPNILSHSARPLDNPELAAAGIAFTLYTDSDYQKEKEESQKKALEEAKAKGNPANLLLGSMFGGFRGGENSLTFKIEDPNSKLIDFRLVDSAGNEIKHTSSTTGGNIKVLFFPNKIPADAGLEIRVLTSQSLMAVPLNLANIPLP